MNKDRVVNHLDEKKIDFSVPHSANDILRALPGPESKEVKLALRRACALNGNAKVTQTTHDSVTFEFENKTTGTYTFSKSNGVNVSGDAFTFNGKPIQEITDKKDLKDMAEAIKDKNPNLDKQEVVDIIKGKDESGAGAAASSSDSGSGAGSKDGAASSSSGAGSKAGAADSSSGAGSKAGAADSSSGAGSKAGAADSSSGDGSKSGAADSSSGDGSGDSSVGAGAADSSSGDGSGDGETPGNEENPETPGETPGEGETPTSDDNISPLISFFTDPKTVLISVASIAGIITLFAILSKTIKARFRKTARSLYRLQKDFGGNPNGLDMDNAFAGQGSKITSLLTRVFGTDWFGPKGGRGKGAIGLVPFVKNYQDEIKRDYISATKAFNMVSQAGKAGKKQPGAEIHPESNESLNIPTYKSFREAYNARKLNESAYSGEEINESTIAAISTGLLLGRLAYSAGKFIWGKINSETGKMENAQAVQVTKQSTREVCYSIMNCFFTKYFNMEGVSTKLGLDVNHLSDIDKSNVDKFKKLVISMKAEQKDNTKVSKMYSRVQKQYNEMLKRYFTIANKVVENFEKYSKLDKKTGKNKQLSEKESNMLTSGVEKLRMELSRQRDIYENNFFRVVNAIVASPEYIQYIDFIIDYVIPVFETGNAGDADYVLDTMPRKNEYFLVRQTRNSTEAPNPNTIDMRNGNVALVMVEEVITGEKEKNPVVKFKRIGLFKSIKGDAEVKIQENGTVDYKTIKKREVKLDTTAYAKDVNGNEGGDSLSLEYTKWIAIDPIQVINYPPKEGNDTTSIDSSATIGMSRRYNNTEELVFIVPVEDASANKSEGRDTAEYKPDLAVNEAGEEGTEQVGAKKVAKIKFVTKDNENDQDVIITCDNVEEMTVNDVKTLLAGGDINGDKFVEISPNNIQKIKKSVDKIEKSGNAKIQTIFNSNKEDIIKVINNKHYKIDAGNENNNSTKDEVAEALTEKLDIIVGNIIKVCDIKNFKLTRIDNNSYTYIYSLTYQYIPTGVTTTKNNEIAVRVYAYLKGDVPTTENRNKIINALNNNKVELINEYKDTDISVDNNGNVFIYKNNLQIYFLLVKLVNGKANYDENAYDNQRLATGTDNTSLSNNIKKGLEDLIKIYNSDKSDINENKKDVLESIKLEYTHSAVNESMTAVKLVRNAVFESNKNAYLVSMTCWGDGTRINPAKFLEESVKSVVYNATSYSDIANAAKKDKNLNILPLTESVTYQVPMPYNRYAILTNGNPLYEAVAVVTIDATPDHNITSSKFIGVTRIVK